MLTRAYFDLCRNQVGVFLSLPWEPNTFIFRGYDPYIEGLKPSFFMVLGSKGTWRETFGSIRIRKVGTVRNQ